MAQPAARSSYTHAASPSHFENCWVRTRPAFVEERAVGRGRIERVKFMNGLESETTANRKSRHTSMRTHALLMQLRATLPPFRPQRSLEYLTGNEPRV
jgi:hypothetical protein